MLGKKINTTTIRRINAALIFHGIRTAPGISPQALSKATGIDPGTISIILSDLERDDLVRRDVSARTGRSGRPATTLSIDETSRVLIGVAVDIDEIHLVLASLAGTRLASWAAAGSLDRKQVIKTIKTGITALLKQTGYQRSALAGIGVGVPGLVRLDGKLALAPALGWRDVDFGGQLAAALGVPVQIENDIKAAAIAEHLFGDNVQATDFIYLSGHSGIGGGLYLGGKLYRGPQSMAGEVGHMKLVPNGRLCACGARGCFEAYVSERAILTCLREEGVELPDIGAVQRAARAGEAKVLSVLAETGRNLGLGLASLVNILSPSSVILGGSLAELAIFLLPSAKPAFAANTLAEIARDIALTVSQLGVFAVPMGGIAVMLQHFLEGL